ncbi:uncharacterized protein TM35_000192230 [Trypanosoma theileri]|uniref:Uncharacterized protein n=1 Tax=Trypanosoma theileri TaxID=67003 RepID=A0A1X0NUV2_9TRYP|nr:uncharacterized protein TM35_000192230 [Trypanosoma theileri]ORC87979.1 hypothetical protein TM35_000192230 [Trypanosoma theileri]
MISGAAGASLARCTSRIRAPLDHLIMSPSDRDQITTSISTMDAAIVTWYMPLANLQPLLHKRYEAEQFGELISSPIGTTTTTTSTTNNNTNTTSSSSSSVDGATAAAAAENADGGNVPLGLVTLIAGNNYPKKQTLLERCLDPAPHPTISLRIAVIDRVHWQRTAWLAQSICRSLCWGRLPQRIFSINLDWRSDVSIESRFDWENGRYAEDGYTLRVPALNFCLSLRDTGGSPLDRRRPAVAGFRDNESALHRLALAREVNMAGLGGAVYRQPLWSTPSLPNTAEVKVFEPGELFTRCFGVNPPVETPVAAWLLQNVEETLLYAVEGEVEDENEPNSATTYGDRSLTERVQKKAMNRYNGFRDEVRGKVYADIDGKELPR